MFGTLNNWHARVNRAKEFHYRRQGQLELRDKRVGVLVAVSSIISSGLSFWSLNGNSLLAALAACSGAIAFAFALTQLIGNFRDEALQHHTSAKDYNALQAEIEQAKSAPPQSIEEFMRAFRSKWIYVDRHAPRIPHSYYKKCPSEKPPSEAACGKAAGSAPTS